MGDSDSTAVSMDPWKAHEQSGEGYTMQYIASMLTPKDRAALGYYEYARERLEEKLRLGRKALEEGLSFYEVSKGKSQGEISNVAYEISWWSKSEREPFFDLARETIRMGIELKSGMRDIGRIAFKWPEIIEPELVAKLCESVNEFAERDDDEAWQNVHGGLSTLAYWTFSIEEARFSSIDFAKVHRRYLGTALSLLCRVDKTVRGEFLEVLRTCVEENDLIASVWEAVAVHVHKEEVESVFSLDELFEILRVALDGENSRKISDFVRKQICTSILRHWRSFHDKFGFQQKLVDLVNEFIRQNYSSRNFSQIVFLGCAIHKCKGIPKDALIELLQDGILLNEPGTTTLRTVMLALSQSCETGEVDEEKLRCFARSVKEMENGRWVGRTFPQLFSLSELSDFVQSSDAAKQGCALESFLGLNPDKFVAFLSEIDVAALQVDERLTVLQRRIIQRLDNEGELEDTTWCGISMNLMTALTFHEKYYKGMTAAELVVEVVKPLTKGYGSACDLVMKGGKEFDLLCTRAAYCESESAGYNLPLVSPWASEFVSHAWSYTFQLVLDSLQFGTNAATDAFYWYDTLVVDQHSAPNHTASWWDTTFRNCVGTFGVLSLVVDSWEEPRTLTRIWCIWEMFSALTAQAKVQLCFPWSTEQRGAESLVSHANKISAVLEKLDVETAQATFESDKVRILQAIEDSEDTSVESINAQIRSFFSSYLIGYACLTGSEDAVRVLLECKPALNQSQMIIMKTKSFLSVAPADGAKSWASPELMRLLTHGANIPVQNLTRILFKTLSLFQDSKDDLDRDRLSKIIIVLAQAGVDFDRSKVAQWKSQFGFSDLTEEELEPVYELVDLFVNSNSTPESPEDISDSLSIQVEEIDTARMSRRQSSTRSITTRVLMSCLRRSSSNAST